MSNKTQLQTNNTTLASLIQTLQGKAAGSGSSGGVNVGTCTINIHSGGGYVDAQCLQVVNGTIETAWVDNTDGAASITINDAVCTGFIRLTGEKAISGVDVSSPKEVAISHTGAFVEMQDETIIYVQMFGVSNGDVVDITLVY